MSKPRVNTNESVEGALFAELGNHNDDAAMKFCVKFFWIARDYQRRRQESILLLENSILKTNQL